MLASAGGGDAGPGDEEFLAVEGGPFDVGDGDGADGATADGGEDLGVVEGLGVAEALEAGVAFDDGAADVDGEDEQEVDGLGWDWAWVPGWGGLRRRGGGEEGAAVHGWSEARRGGGGARENGLGGGIGGGGADGRCSALNSLPGNGMRLNEGDWESVATPSPRPLPKGEGEGCTRPAVCHRVTGGWVWSGLHVRDRGVVLEGGWAGGGVGGVVGGDVGDDDGAGAG